MRTTTFSCDACGKDITDGGATKHRLMLSEDYIRFDRLEDIASPLLDREQHFCGFKCLDQWSLGHGEKP